MKMNQQTNSTEPRPSIGRIVNYTNLGDKDGKYPPEIQAAVITGVYHAAPGGDETGDVGAKANEVGAKPTSMFVDLKVFYRTGLFDTVKVGFSPEPKRGHWNWPPRS
jgi:hypothetical protein